MSGKWKKLFSLLTLIVLMLIISFGCVETLTDTQSSSSATPTIEVTSPKSGDTVKIGKNYIAYQAAEGSGGQGLSFYEIYVNKIYTSRFEQNTNGTNPLLFLTLDSAYLHTKISYSVKVYNKTGRSKESKTFDNIWVKDKVPNAPLNLFLAKLNDFSVTLKWEDNSKNEDGFELWRKDVVNGTVIDFRKIKTLPVNSITTTDAALSPFADYIYKVRAFNESGPSDFSNETSTNSLPGGPWNLQAEAIGASLVRLTWVDFVTNELGFQIERTDPYTNTFKVLTIVPPNTQEYFDNSVSANNWYKYRVAYFTQTTQSSYSNEASISTFYTDVAAPTNLSASLLPGMILQLSWTDNSKYLSKGTIVERRTGPDGPFYEFGTAASDENKFNDITVASGKTYYYRVRQILDKKIFTPYSVILRVDIP